jgi:hypothetical protein
MDLAAFGQQLPSGSGRERREDELGDPGAGQEVVDRVQPSSGMASILFRSAVPIIRAVMENRTSAVRQAVTTSER